MTDRGNPVRRGARAAHAVPRGLVALVLAIALSGCGDPDLWARYRAERAEWTAARYEQRVRIHPRLASDADYARADRAYEKIVESFPADEWATSIRLEDPEAREVAAIAGRAALARGRLAEMRGDVDAALVHYRSVLQTHGGVRAVALDAALYEANALERSRRTAEAAAAWARVGTAFEVVDGNAVRRAVIEAPRRAARLYDEAGEGRSAQAVLAAASGRLERLLESLENGAPRAELLDELGENRTMQKRVDRALAAWRTMLSLDLQRDERSRVILRMSEAALRSGHPDTALVYAAWAGRAPGPDERVRALMLSASAYDAQGVADSAIAVYARVLELFPRAEEAGARARYERARILERRGTWEQARSEYRALSSRYPTHPLAITALMDIVRYHARLGQAALARIEGQRALEIVDRLIEHQRDRGVQFRARHTRAEILDAIGDHKQAYEAYRGFWLRYPDTDEGQAAGLTAAGLAETRLDDTARAIDLYRQVDARAAGRDAKERARAALVRLGAESG